MIPGFAIPREPLLVDLNIPKYFNTYKKIWKRFRKIRFVNLIICFSGKLWKVYVQIFWGLSILDFEKLKIGNFEIKQLQFGNLES